MSIRSALARYFNVAGVSAGMADATFSPPREQQRLATTPVELPYRDLYGLLQGMYLTNGVYDGHREALTAAGVLSSSIRPIRNPVAATVNVLGAKMYPNPMRVITPLTQGITSQQERDELEANDPIKAAIDQVAAWSNAPRSDRKHGRWVALYGEAFSRVIADAEKGRVYFQHLEPQYVTDYTLDERDYLADCRIDILQRDSAANGTGLWTYTEHWSRDLGTLRVWRTEGDCRDKPLEDLGTNPEETPLSAFGIDFVPIVRTPFMELDDGRAIGAVQLAVEGIIESDLMSTNLHSLLPNLGGAKVLKSIGSDGFGRQLPAPVVRDATTDGAIGRQTDGSVLTARIGGRELWTLPGGQELQDVIPNIDFAAALTVLQDHDEHLQRLMPALAYLRITELTGGDLSGRAISYKLRPFVDQVEEARENILASRRQANMMALTMGQVAGIFSGLGTFEAGDFEHEYEDTPILSISSLDEAEEQRTRGQAAQALASAGVPMSYILTSTLDLSEVEAEELVDAAAADAEEAFERQQALAVASSTDDNEDTDNPQGGE
jgi:hypothetical protein